jgi:predicted 2-oxoglutarate/Fe(II)-dependent dioxygenase YbiX
MQPKIIEDFINIDTAKYINDYFIKNVKLDNKGYANIYINKLVPFYNTGYLLNNLIKKDKEESLFCDILNLLMISIKAQFLFNKNEIDAEFFNYRRFSADDEVKGYHLDDYGGPGDLKTALLYLNEDYDGGEIIFYDNEYKDNVNLKEENSITYKPKTGSLFLFNDTDAHSVNPVLNGERALFTMNLRNPPLTKTF